MQLSLSVKLSFPEIKDFFDVSYRDCPIGRVWLAREIPASDRPWEWLLSLPMDLPDSTKGRARTMNDAMGALAAEFGRLLTRTEPARLQRAFEFALALELKSAGAAGSGANSERPAIDAAVAALMYDLPARGSHEDAEISAAAAPAEEATVPEAAPAVEVPAPAAATAEPVRSPQLPPPAPQVVEQPPKAPEQTVKVAQQPKAQGRSIKLNLNPQSGTAPVGKRIVVTAQNSRAPGPPAAPAGAKAPQIAPSRPPSASPSAPQTSANTSAPRTSKSLAAQSGPLPGVQPGPAPAVIIRPAVQGPTPLPALAKAAPPALTVKPAKAVQSRPAATPVPSSATPPPLDNRAAGNDAASLDDIEALFARHA
jgi:hypothetical protein